MKSCPKCGKEYADNFESCSLDGAALIANRSGTDPLLGGIFAGRYQFIEKIGQGGMGAVYKAIHTRMNRICAIKLLSADQAEGQNPVERFNREAQMASRIDNPHAVVIYDFGETDDGVLYLVMEYVEGESLGRALLRERTFSPQRACAIARQIAEALGAAHALGIVHRDLKPDNVMLSKRLGGGDYVKVLDFGIAKTVSHEAAEDLTQTGFVLGTPAYMSPEQLLGDKLDARSDIYSLALIVYQMLSGKLPFEGENTQARLMKRLIDAPVPLRNHAPSIGAALASAVMAGLARNRDDRPASAALFANSLQACVDVGSSASQTRLTEPVSSMPASPVTAGGMVSPGGPPPRETARQTDGPTEADGLPTVPIGSHVTNANEPETQGYSSPSSYVTRQSTTPMVSESSSGRPGHSLQHESGLESAEPASPALPNPASQARAERPTPGFDDAPAPVIPKPVDVLIPEAVTPLNREQQNNIQPAVQPSSFNRQPSTNVQPSTFNPPQTRINPRQGPPVISPTAAQPAHRTGGGKRTAIGVIIAVMGIGLLLVAGAGIFVYLRYFRNPVAETPRVSKVPSPGPTAAGVPTPAPSATVAIGTGTEPPRTTPNAEAAAHLAAGKAHQKQAEMLAGSGSASAADEERLKAIAEYNQAIKLQPDYPEARENLGTALYDSGRVSDALDEYKTAIAQYTVLRGAPTSQVEFNYGLALFDTKRYRDAASAFGRALELDPSDHELLVHRGFALQNAGDYASAKRDYQQYLTLEPSGQYAEGVKQILTGRAKPPAGTR